MEFVTGVKPDYISIVRPKFLTREFLAQYQTKPVPFGQLGAVVYLRTYSRYIEQLKRREVWWETCMRVVEYSFSLLEQAPKNPFRQIDLQFEAQELFDLFFNLKAFPAGRTLFVGGTKAAKLNPTANFNCSFVAITEIKAFVDAMTLLMLGAGVGYSVENKHVRKLPLFRRDIFVAHVNNVVPAADREEDTTSTFSGNVLRITIGDSKKGWTDALDLFLKYSAYNIGVEHRIDNIIIDYGHVRPTGERLKTFGGRASGYLPLQNMFKEVNAIIKNPTGRFQLKDRVYPVVTLEPETVGRLSGVDAMDIMNSIAKSIVVGGTRRSAQIALGDVEDTNFIDAKLDLFTDPTKEKFRTTRVLSNNSVHLWKKPSRDKFHEIFETLKTNGEPGIYIAENAAKRRPNYAGTNPCFTGDTLILTRDGHFPIKDLVGKTTDIWDGDEWVTVDSFRVTGENQATFKLTMHDGSEICATKYHRFLLEDGRTKELKDLLVGDKLMMSDKTVSGTVKTVGAYAKGFLLAEGTNCHGTKPKLNVYFTKYSCLPKLLGSIAQVEAKSYGTHEKLEVSASSDGENRVLIQGLSARRDEFLDYATKYKYEFPIEVLNWCDQDKADFIAGYMDGDGTAADTKNGFMYQVTSISREFLLGFQTLLKSIGVQSKIALLRKAGMKDFNDGYGEYKTKDAWRLTISQTSAVALAQFVDFERLVSFEDKKLSYNLKPRRNRIASIEAHEISDKVYCVTNQKSSKVSLSVGFTTRQCSEIALANRGVCNLVTLNLSAFVAEDGTYDYAGAEAAHKLITRVCSRQTLVTLWDKDWDFVQKRDRLLGISLTGYVDAEQKMGDRYDIPHLLQALRVASNHEANDYHELLGINPPVLVTTVKPEGTISQLPTVSSGVHAPYAPYYIRRIRVSKADPIAMALVEMGFEPSPENHQGDDLMAPECTTWVFTFHVKTHAKGRSIDEPAIDQLERYKMFMRYYCDHNVSCTVSVAPEEWEAVEQWVWDNYEHCIGISFLPRFDPEQADSPYPQAPYETITEAQYEPVEIDETKLMKLIAKYEAQYEEYDLDSDCGSKGFCPVR